MVTQFGTWEYPPLAIANQYYDQQADEVKRARYRLILVRGSDLRWLNRERFQEVQAGLRAHHKWLPEQNLPFSEVVLYAYAADRTHFPTYVCLPTGLYKARTGHIVAQTGPDQEILSLPGIYFFDGWRLHPKLSIPDHLPRAKEAPVQGTAPNAPAPDTEPKRSPEEEARDILAVKPTLALAHKANCGSQLLERSGLVGARQLPRTSPRLTNTLRTLEDTHAVLQQTELLAGVINEQDCRDIHSCHAVKAARCDLGDPGWGDPWFPH